MKEPKFLVTDEEKWLAARAEYVTSTDVSALLGVNKYKTANQIRQTKQLGPEEATPEALVYFELGHKWEQAVIDAGIEELGLQNVPYITQGFYTDEKARLSATPDAIFEDGRLIEAKTTGLKNLRYWKTMPPIQYVVQAQVQLMVTGGTDVYITGLFFSPWPSEEATPQAISIHRVVKSVALQKKILDKVKHFWHNYDNEDYRYVVPSFEKEEIEKMIKETSSFVVERHLDVFMPRDSITENDKQIIRQVVIEAATKYVGDYSPVTTILKQAEVYMEAYLTAVDTMAQYVPDPATKNPLIALQSALKRVAELKVENTDVVESLVRIAHYTLLGKVL